MAKLPPANNPGDSRSLLRTTFCASYWTDHLELKHYGTWWSPVQGRSLKRLRVEAVWAIAAVPWLSLCSQGVWVQGYLTIFTSVFTLLSLIFQKDVMTNPIFYHLFSFLLVSIIPKLMISLSLVPCMKISEDALQFYLLQ